MRVLSRVFRGKFVAGLKPAFCRNKLAFHGTCLPLADKITFGKFRRTLFREDWVVYPKRPFGGPEHVLHYLARYTHRVAISNHRRVDLTETHVTFRWKDYAHHNKRRTMTLTHEIFLRRFLEHVLPRGFQRIRYFGFSRIGVAVFSYPSAELCWQLGRQQTWRTQLNRRSGAVLVAKDPCRFWSS